MNASTAGSARPSFRPDSRLSEWRTSRGHARVRDHGRRQHRVGRREQRSHEEGLRPAEIGERVRHERDEHAGERHGQRQLAQREVPSLLEHLLLDLEAVAEQDHDQCHHGEALHELPRWDRDSAPRIPPSPSANPAATKAAVSDRNDLRASPEMSAPATSSSPNTASGASRKSTPAASGGTRELCQTGSSHLATVVPVMRRPCVLVASGVAARCGRPGRAGARRGRRASMTLSSGWELRVAPAAPAEPQPAPPEETAPEGAGPAIPATAAGVAAQAPGEWQPATGAERVRHARAAVAVSGPGAALPGELPRPAPLRAGSAGCCASRASAATRACS